MYLKTRDHTLPNRTKSREIAKFFKSIQKQSLSIFMSICSIYALKTLFSNLMLNGG